MGWPRPLPHRASCAPLQSKPDNYAQKGVYSKKRDNPARCQPGTASLMVQISVRCAAAGEAKQIRVDHWLIAQFYDSSFVSSHVLSVSSEDQKQGAFAAVCWPESCLPGIFQGVTPLGWGYRLLFSPLATTLISALLVDWSFSAGRCLHERGGFAEGCADVYASVLL